MTKEWLLENLQHAINRGDADIAQALGLVVDTFLTQSEYDWLQANLWWNAGASAVLNRYAA